MGRKRINRSKIKEHSHKIQKSRGWLDIRVNVSDFYKSFWIHKLVVLMKTTIIHKIEKDQQHKIYKPFNLIKLLDESN